MNGDRDWRALLVKPHGIGSELATLLDEELRAGRGAE
jgi:hypothetical protein